MKGKTPKERAKELDRVLKRLYDRYGKRDNVVDMLTDLRHLCDGQGLDFGECDRIAYQNYLPEMATQSMDVD
jgi:hypothetical protein